MSLFNKNLLQTEYYLGQFDACAVTLAERLSNFPDTMLPFHASLTRTSIFKAYSILKEFIDTLLAFLNDLGLCFQHKSGRNQAPSQLCQTKKMDRSPAAYLLGGSLATDPPLIPIEIMQLLTLHVLVNGLEMTSYTPTDPKWMNRDQFIFSDVHRSTMSLNS